MPKYSQNVLEEIKGRLRLSDIIGTYVSLTRQGRSDDYKACCPFHSEKTPSFYVHDDKGFYKCFGCQKSGNMFTFVMEMEHLTFSEAVETLAKKAGIELREESEAEKEQNSKKETIQDLYNRICASYHYILLRDNSSEGVAARSYLEERKISSETAERFMLGYAVNNSSWLYNFLKHKNYSEELMRESGLFSKNYPRLPLFRNRVLFPIRTWKGDCVAFSGRDLSGDSKAKYVNSPETSLYSKRHILFGFYESLKTLKEKGRIIICEGNFDVVSLHQAGVTNAVAPLGTALTVEQIGLIKRYCKKASLLFDTDEPGINATIKALILCQKNDLECNVIKPFTSAKDASEILQKEGEDALRMYTENTIPAISYLVQMALNRYDTRTPKGKLAVLKEASPFLDATTSKIERQGYIKYIAEVIGIREEEILSDYEGNARNNQSNSLKENELNNAQKQELPSLTPELNALLLILKNRQYFNYLKKEIKFADLEDENARILFTVLEDNTRDSTVSLETLISTIQNEVLRNFVFSYMQENNNPSKLEEVIFSSVKSLKLKKLYKKRDKLSALINSMMNINTEENEWHELLESKGALDREIEELKREEE